MSEWKDLYGKNVWAKSRPKDHTFWPSIICDPATLLNPDVREQAEARINKQYCVRYYGMPLAQAYGYASRSNIVLHDENSCDKYYKQKEKPRYSEFFETAKQIIKGEAPDPNSDITTSLSAAVGNKPSPTKRVPKSDTSTGNSADDNDAVQSKKRGRPPASLKEKNEVSLRLILINIFNILY